MSSVYRASRRARVSPGAPARGGILSWRLRTYRRRGRARKVAAHRGILLVACILTMAYREGYLSRVRRTAIRPNLGNTLAHRSGLYGNYSCDVATRTNRCDCRAVRGHCIAESNDHRRRGSALGRRRDVGYARGARSEAAVHARVASRIVSSRGPLDGAFRDGTNCKYHA